MLNTDVKSTGQQPVPHVAHLSSGLGHRHLKAEEVSHSLLPSEFIGESGVRQALEDYVNHLRNRGMSDRHISDLLFYLEKYCAWLGNTLATLSAESAEKYLSKSNHLKPNSRAKYAAYLNGFLKFCGIEFDVKVKVPKTLPGYVEDADIEKMADWIETKSTHKDTIQRDLTLLQTAKRTGMRRSELGNLKVRDITSDQNKLFVRGGKGDKDRVIPIHPELRESLFSLCEGKSPDDTVFGLKPRTITGKFRDWAVRSGVNLHTHSFRHNFATSLLEKGANIKAVQELLGHSSLDTTQVYLSVTGKHLEDAIQLLE